jgi:hypothetical protein
MSPGPDEEEMREAEHRQPEQPARLQPARRPARPGALGEQHDPGAEQQREQAAELAVDQHQLAEPEQLVRRSRAAGQVGRPEVAEDRIAMRDDVREQDPEHGDPANEVERDDALVAADRFLGPVGNGRDGGVLWVCGCSRGHGRPPSVPVLRPIGDRSQGGRGRTGAGKNGAPATLASALPINSKFRVICDPEVRKGRKERVAGRESGGLGLARIGIGFAKGRVRKDHAVRGIWRSRRSAPAPARSF